MVAAASRGVRESTCIHCAMTTDRGPPLGTLAASKDIDTVPTKIDHSPYHLPWTGGLQICREPWIGDWALGKGRIAQIWEIRPPIG